MCNIDGKGSTVLDGDVFYLVMVQFCFGLTEGWFSSTSMLEVAVWVQEEEREGAGAFVSFTLVGGFVFGSVVSLANAQA